MIANTEHFTAGPPRASAPAVYRSVCERNDKLKFVFQLQNMRITDTIKKKHRQLEGKITMELAKSQVEPRNLEILNRTINQLNR